MNFSEEDSIVTKYHYCLLPILYAQGGIKQFQGRYKNINEMIRQLIESKRLYAELMDKGFVDFEVDNEESAFVASAFISIVQNNTGSIVCDPTEIAKRRGLI